MKNMLTCLATLMFTVMGCAHNGSKSLRGPDELLKMGLRSAIRARKKDFRKCYDDALKQNSDLKGKVIVVWTVETGGVTKDAAVSESTVNNTLLENCIVQTINFTTFPEPPNDQIARITYPFVFTND